MEIHSLLNWCILLFFSYRFHLSNLIILFSDFIFESEKSSKNRTKNLDYIHFLCVPCTHKSMHIDYFHFFVSHFGLLFDQFYYERVAYVKSDTWWSQMNKENVQFYWMLWAKGWYGFGCIWAAMLTKIILLCISHQSFARLSTTRKSFHCVGFHKTSPLARHGMIVQMIFDSMIFE